MELLTEINWGIIAPFLVIQVLLIIVALIDWIKTAETNGPKWIWLLIIMLISMIGPIVYFIFVRKNYLMGYVLVANNITIQYGVHTAFHNIYNSLLTDTGILSTCTYGAT